MRPLFKHECPLVTFLFDLVALQLPADLVVQPMEDGGMGSLALAPFGDERRFGSAPAECHFHDSDGVYVLATLILDQNDSPYEIDVWKVDFSPLHRWPLLADLTAGSA